MENSHKNITQKKSNIFMTIFHCALSCMCGMARSVIVGIRTHCAFKWTSVSSLRLLDLINTG